MIIYDKYFLSPTTIPDILSLEDEVDSGVRVFFDNDENQTRIITFDPKQIFNINELEITIII